MSDFLFNKNNSYKRHVVCNKGSNKQRYLRVGIERVLYDRVCVYLLMLVLFDSYVRDVRITRQE